MIMFELKLDKFKVPASVLGFSYDFLEEKVLVNCD